MRQNVSQNASWGLDGLDPDVRDAAREAARRAGMSLDEWLSVAIADRASRAYAEAPVRRRVAAGGHAQPGQSPGGYDELDGVASRLGRITRGPAATQGQGAGQSRVQAASRNLDQVIAQLTAEQDRRARESAAKTAEALDSVARWIERAEERMADTTKLVSERQDRAAAVLGEALGLMTRRLDDIDRRVAEGHQPSMNAALKAVEKVEQHLARLEARRREESEAAAERDAARDAERQAAIDAKIEAALRGFEERIAAISERVAGAAPGPRGRRGLSVREELQEAVAEIRSRQKALDGEASDAPAPRAPAPAEPARDGRSHAEILDGLRADIAKLAGQLETVRPRGPDPVPAVEAVREEIADLRETVSGLATRSEVGALEEILRNLSREASQTWLQARLGQAGGPDAATMGATLARLEGEVRRLSDEVARNAPTHLLDAFDALSHKVDLVAEAGLDPQVVQTLADQVAELRGLLDEIAEPTRVEGLAEQVGALAQQVERMARSQVDPLEFATMRTAVEDIREHLTTPREEAGVEALAALGTRIEALAEKLEAATGALSRTDLGALTRQIDGLAKSASTLETRSGAVDLSPLAGQIEALGARIDTLAGAADASPVAEQIAALEKRLAERAQPPAPSALFAKLDVMAEKLDALAETRRAEPPLDLDGLLRRLDRIDERLQTPREDERLRPLETMLAGLAARLEEAPRDGSDGLEALERQIGEIAARLERDRGADPALAALERSMTELMAQVDGLKDGLKETAVAPAGEETGLAALTRSIEGLKASQAEAERKSRDTLSAVHGTLEALVARLATLEAGGAPAKDARRARPADAARETAAAKPAPAKAAPAPGPEAAAREPGGFDLSAFRGGGTRTPPAEPRLDTAAAALLAEADAPAPAPADEILLEPGSGRPQPARMRKPQAEETDGGDIKASFIAAARRAAQSAAAEAAAAAKREKPGAEEAGTPAGLASRMRSVLERRRKPLLLGLAAIVLAIGALQVTQMLSRSDRVADVAEPRLGVSADVGPVQDVLPGSATSTEAGSDPAPASIADAPETTQSVPEPSAAADPARAPMPTFMGLPAAPLANGIPAGDLVVPAPTSAADEEAAAREILLPPRRDEATAFVARVVTPDAPAAAAAAPIPVSPLVAGLDIPADVGPAQLRRAALAGDRTALFELASRLSDGRDAARDPQLSAALLERLAETGMVPAQYRIGQIYDKGVGVPRDPQAAEAWYRRAAESGNVTAMHNLAVLLAEGAVGGQPDYTGAIGWFRRAAEHGVRDSQYNLAVLLARGLGAPQDLSASYTWFAIAAAQGDADAAARQEELAARLSESDRVLARSAADAWRPETPDPAANEVALPAHGWNDRTASLLAFVRSA
jgi:localization factor PodJL